MAFRRWYFKSKWNLFDFVILIFSFIDIILDKTLFESLEAEQDSEDCENLATSLFSPSIFRIAKAVRLLRLLRSLRLVKVRITFPLFQTPLLRPPGKTRPIFAFTCA